MIADLLELIIDSTVLLLVIALGVAHLMPARGTVHCPPGWYLDGVRPSGMFACRPVLGHPEDDLLDAVRRRVIADDRVIKGRIYCTGGATPRQDGGSVWCQR